MKWWLHVRWTRLRINWFTVAWHCRRGHTWRAARVGSLELTDCSRCGRFGGYRRTGRAA
jgi:hypothetical protein